MQNRLIVASYIIGPVALIAALVDDEDDPEQTFHLRQALGLNLIVGAASGVVYGLWAPGYIMEAGLSGTTVAVLGGPLLVVLAGLAYLGLQAARGSGTEIPILAQAVRETMGDRA